MIWKKITIETNVEAADIVASVLFDNGIVGAEIEDNQNLTKDELSKMYVDIPKINIDDGKSKVSFYVSIGEKSNDQFANCDKNLVDNSYMKSTDNIFSSDEYNSILDNVKNELEDYRQFMDMGSLNFSETELDDNDFLNNWKKNFKSINIGDINILPSWEKGSDGINIYIEPGNAFGTGQHATTKLCVEAIKDIVKNNKHDVLLDIGAGSGILSIIAYKLGVNRVLAVDIDENCEFNLLENFKLNHIDDIYKIDSSAVDISKLNHSMIYGFGNILTDKWLEDTIQTVKYDLVVANILAPVIISLIEKANIVSYINDGGYLILSGIIKEKEQDVIKSLNKINHIKNVRTVEEGDWVAIVVKC